MQKDNAEHGRHKRIQRAEHARTLGGRSRLRHRLEREPEAAAHHGEREHAHPLQSTLRQARRLRDAGGDQAQHADDRNLHDSGRERVDVSAVRETVGGQDRAGIERGGRDAECLAGAEADAAAKAFLRMAEQTGLIDYVN